MFSRLSAAAHKGGDDVGLGMLMVIGLTGVMTILIGVLITTVVNSLEGSARHDHFDLALTSAESGIDETLSRIQADYVNNGGIYYTPSAPTTFDSNPACNTSTIQWGGPWTGANATNQERDWARNTITALVAAHPTCLQHSEDGDFVAIAPGPNANGVNAEAVYSLGWSPGYGVNNAESRLIKAEYLFVPYAPSNAIETGGNLQIDSSTTVNTPTGVSGCLAQIHSNGSITIGGGAAQLNGQVSSTVPSSGTYKHPQCTGTQNTGSVTTTPAQPVPVISAREVYTRNAVNNSQDWYDLCTDGTVREASSSGPCTGTIWPGGDATTVAAQGFRGWNFLGSNGNGTVTWQGSKGGISDGVYYAYDANVTQDKANPSTNSATIIAQAINDTSCPRVGGNISWDANNIGSPALQGLFMLADSDLSTTSNFYAGSPSAAGLFVAGDQVSLQTSSQGAYGGVIAADQCPVGGLSSSIGTTDEVKNPEVTYVPNATAPFTSIIDTTLWLEYTGP